MLRADGTALADRVPPMAALSVAVVAVSTSAILIRLSAAPSAVKAFYRVVFTLGLLVPPALTRYRDHFLRLDRRDLGLAALSGLALAVHFAAWFESVELTSVAASVTLVQSQPLFVAVGAWWLLSERFTTRIVAGIAVALAGMAAMTLGGPLVAALAGDSSVPAGALEGNLLAVLGAVAAAGYVLAGRSVRQRVALIPYVVVVYAVCAVGLLVAAVADGGAAALTGYPPREWLLFLGMAVGPGVFGHTVVNWALAHVESSVVSVSLLGEPVGSTLLALAILSEVPTPPTLVGGTVVLAGIYLAASDRGQEYQG